MGQLNCQLNCKLFVVAALYFPLLVAQHVPLEDTNSEPVPRIVSETQNVTTLVGETIRVDCNVENLGSHNHSWTKGTHELFRNSKKVTSNSRFFPDGTSMVIRNINIVDKGLYRCNIDTLPNRTSVRHFVHVINRVTREPDVDEIAINQYDNFVLSCHHYWKLRLGWYYKANMHDEERFLGYGISLPIRNWTLSMSGVYTCRSDDKVEFDEFRVMVQSAPEVQMATVSKMASLGQAVQLECIVKENFVQSQVEWRRANSTILSTGSPRVVFSSMSNITTATLIFDRIHQDNYGNYTCFANNSLGSASRTVEITMSTSVSSTSFIGEMGTTLIAIIGLLCLSFIILSFVIYYFVMRRRKAHDLQSVNTGIGWRSDGSQKIGVADQAEHVYEEIYYGVPNEYVYERKYLKLTEQ
ncbi:Opioid-binding protein/cell adhesion molecule [Halotydeus destructor]|nr:Opioid-binding protein/cell adhesion molecule [Halotydeus destructor]